MRRGLTLLILLVSVGCAPVEGVVARVDASTVPEDTARTMAFEGRLLATALDRIHLTGEPAGDPVLDEAGEPICVHLWLVSPGGGWPDAPVGVEPPWGFEHAWLAPCDVEQSYPASEPFEELDGTIVVDEAWPPAVELDLEIRLDGTTYRTQETVQTAW